MAERRPELAVGPSPPVARPLIIFLQILASREQLGAGPMVHESRHARRDGADPCSRPWTPRTWDARSAGWAGATRRCAASGDGRSGLGASSSCSTACFATRSSTTGSSGCPTASFSPRPAWSGSRPACHQRLTQREGDWRRLLRPRSYCPRGSAHCPGRMVVCSSLTLWSSASIFCRRLNDQIHSDPGPFEATPPRSIVCP